MRIIRLIDDDLFISSGYDALFHIEEQIKDLSPGERKQKRDKLARPILNELHDWVFRLNAAPKSLLRKAAHYTREQWQ